MTFTRLDNVWVNFLSQVCGIRIWFWWMSKKGRDWNTKKTIGLKCFRHCLEDVFYFFWCHMCKIMFVFCQNMICWPILAQLQIVHKLLNLGFFSLKTITYTPKPIPNSHPHFAKVMSPTLLSTSFPQIFRRPQDLCFTSMAWFQSSRSSRWHHRWECVDLKFSGSVDFRFNEQRKDT